MRGLVRGATLALATTVGLVSHAVSPASTIASSVVSPTTTTTVLTANQKALLTSYSDSMPFASSVTTTTLAHLPETIKGRPVVSETIRPHSVTTSTYQIGEPLWWTWTYDPTAYEPTSDDPTHTLPLSVQSTFACIRYAESRNHPNDTNQYSGAQGLYQFLPYLWAFGASHVGIETTSANLATPQQQSAVAVWFYNYNHGFAPEWQDGCVGE